MLDEFEIDEIIYNAHCCAALFLLLQKQHKRNKWVSTKLLKFEKIITQSFSQKN